MSSAVIKPLSNTRLSICITTYNRAGFIGETLDSILIQAPADVEVIVVDGASPDNTSAVMDSYVHQHPGLRYFRESENSGIDRDYDKAVTYARGDFCWLMTDDDLLCAGAIERVLQALDNDLDLLVVDAEVRDAAMQKVLKMKRMKIVQNRDYTSANWQQFFIDTAGALSFIGGTVIRRSVWLDRDRSHYWGTLFVHVGVIFQRPMRGNIRVIADPLILIRYGNAMWTARGFEIWMFKWPDLVWSFDAFPIAARNEVVPQAPWKQFGALAAQRAMGAYDLAQYRRFISPRSYGVSKVVGYCLAVAPGSLLNAVVAVYCYIARRRMGLCDMALSRYSNRLSRFLASRI